MAQDKSLGTIYETPVRKYSSTTYHFQFHFCTYSNTRKKNSLHKYNLTVTSHATGQK